jgi:AcrR family transcriptional regulator
MDTRDKILKMIEKMLTENECINIHAVAEKCGVSHSLIYNRYPDIKERIKELKKIQQERKKAADDEALIGNLLAKNKVLRERVRGDDRVQEATAFKTLLAHVQEVYSMYDGLLDDRNRLAAKVVTKLEKA